MEVHKNDLNENIATNLDIEVTKKIIFDLLKAVGEDPHREGLKNTPDRVARMYTELLSGYSEKAAYDVRTNYKTQYRVQAPFRHN